MWTSTGELQNNRFQKAIAEALHTDLAMDLDEGRSKQTHHVAVSAHARGLLEKITRSEYAALSLRPHPVPASPEDVDSPREEHLFFYTQQMSPSVAICWCAKCGSSSLSRYLYSVMFGREWPYSGAPWPQEMGSPRWEGQFKSVSGQKARDADYTFALMRDPKERLISSFKSKVSCRDKWYNTDTTDRVRLVRELLELAGLGTSRAHCMRLGTFLDTLRKIHSLGRAQLLDAHFRPQHYDCFKDLRPDEMTKAAFISDPDFKGALAAALGTNATVPRYHASGSESARREPEITPRDHEALEEITREEYRALGLRAA